MLAFDKKLGFGCMRLPEIVKDKEINIAAMTEMVDFFMANGFNYFDTAICYHEGLSETSLKTCLTSRYSRESYVLTNKLTNEYFERNEDIEPLFLSQLKACGVDYFDIYLMHALDYRLYCKYKRVKAIEKALEFKERGMIKHVGISFHDTPEVLETILTEYPQIEIVQIQLNYADYENIGIQSRRCLETCEKFNKPVIVMEPVKGGRLVNLPVEAKKIIDELDGGSPASYAIRFAASFDSVVMVLSGMSNIEQMKENVSFMKEFVPLNERELTAVKKVADIVMNDGTIKCTACRYCVSGCPKKILIPLLIGDYNLKKTFNEWNSEMYYATHTEFNGKAKDCISCGKCERICPQHLKIREIMADISKEFDK